MGLYTGAEAGKGFMETQRFKQVWLWVLILPISALLVAFFGYVMVSQLILGHPVGARPMPDAVLVIFGICFILLGICMPCMFYGMKLITRIEPDHIRLDFIPVRSLTIPFRDVVSCSACTYSPVIQYLGWGVRWTPWSGWAYSTSGNKGVKLELADGSSVLIGSSEAAELAGIINGRIRGNGTF